MGENPHRLLKPPAENSFEQFLDTFLAVVSKLTNKPNEEEPKLDISAEPPSSETSESNGKTKLEVPDGPCVSEPTINHATEPSSVTASESHVPIPVSNKNDESATISTVHESQVFQPRRKSGGNLQLGISNSLVSKVDGTEIKEIVLKDSVMLRQTIKTDGDGDLEVSGQLNKPKPTKKTAVKQPKLKVSRKPKPAVSRSLKGRFGSVMRGVCISPQEFILESAGSLI